MTAKLTEAARAAIASYPDEADITHDEWIGDLKTWAEDTKRALESALGDKDKILKAIGHLDCSNYARAAGDEGSAESALYAARGLLLDVAGIKDRDELKPPPSVAQILVLVENYAKARVRDAELRHKDNVPAKTLRESAAKIDLTIAALTEALKEPVKP